MTDPFLGALVDTLVDQMGAAFPELRANRDSIVQVVRREEERFDAVLNDGLPRLEAALERAARQSGIVDGDEVFRLYDTFGLPLDFVEDLAGERGLTLDRTGFEHALEGQRQTSRAGQTFEPTEDSEFGYASDETKLALQQVDDHFEGYDTTTVAGATVLALFDGDRQQVNELGEGAAGYAILDRTPFYVESGGQVSDTGRIVTENGPGQAIVSGMGRLTRNGPRVHAVRVLTDRLTSGARVTAEVDERARNGTRRNHTATHLLHAALRGVLGTHVNQAGSLVAPDRLRFDFTHFEIVSPSQVAEIERRVNSRVYTNYPVETDERATDEAIADGATALFGEKYGDRVRVVSVPGVSVELCGGTHCRATGDIGPFVITQESGVAAGIRRVEALTGDAAVQHLQKRHAAFDGVLKTLGVPQEQALKRWSGYNDSPNGSAGRSSGSRSRLPWTVRPGPPATTWPSSTA